MKPNITFTGTEISSNFNVKDPVSFTIVDQFVKLKVVMRIMLVNVLEAYMRI